MIDELAIAPGGLLTLRAVEAVVNSLWAPRLTCGSFTKAHDTTRRSSGRCGSATCCARTPLNG
jgi:hypothetical protein